jgi:hypothetical protein
VGGKGVEVGLRVGIAVKVKVGIAIGFVFPKMEQALRTSMNKSRLATMGFFTRPSL